MKTPIELIAAEQSKNKALGLNLKSEEFSHGQLAFAAAAYLTYVGRVIVPMYWPWATSNWQPSKDRLENLARAGALVIAEMERVMLEREKCQDTPSSDMMIK